MGALRCRLLYSITIEVVQLGHVRKIVERAGSQLLQVGQFLLTLLLAESSGLVRGQALVLQAPAGLCVAGIVTGAVEEHPGNHLQGLGNGRGDGLGVVGGHGNASPWFGWGACRIGYKPVVWIDGVGGRLMSWLR